MPNDTEPLVRARLCQEWLAFVDTEEEPWRSRFLERVAPETREMIESASRVAWLPSAVHVELADAVQEAFGAVRAHAYYRRAFAASLDGPILGPLMRTGVRVFGLKVPTFLRWASRGWEASFRNCGSLAGEVLGPDPGTLTYRDLPEVCWSSDGWMLSAQGSAYGAYDVLGVSGVVRVDMSGRSEGKMVLNLEWNRPAPRDESEGG